MPQRRTGWFARWFGCKPRQPDAPAETAPPAPKRRRARGKHPLFTPETNPGLTAEDCAFLNTPLGECDPEMVRRLLAALSEGIADAMGPALGMDADALFAQFCGRLFVTQDAAAPDASSAPGEVAAAEDNAAPAGQPDSEPPAQADAAADVPPAPPGAPLLPDAAASAEDAAHGADTAAADSPHADFPITPALPGSRSAMNGSSRFLPRRKRPGARRCRTAPRRGLPRESRSSPPPRRLFYAACAGPP